MCNYKIKYLLLLLFVFSGFQYTHAQFDPPAGKPGTKAMHADSALFISWAKSCIVERGLEDCADSNSNKVSTGQDEFAVGKADGAVVSLGDGGMATLTFDFPIVNGQGADFAVFENSFSDNYLELAFVEVSSDGVHFVRFPSVSNTDTTTQIGSFGSIDASQLYNLAGKYKASYGTPFDLEELKDSIGLDINNIMYVRIRDVIGSINDSFCTRDSKGAKVNDPYPTAFESGGFDLDAVGVIHNTENFSSIKKIEKQLLTFPNPVQALQYFIFQSDEELNVRVFDMQGKMVFEDINKVCIHNLIIETSGVYIIKWVTASGKTGDNKLIVR